MTVARALLVLFMMVAVGIAMVVIRGETAKAAHRVHNLHRDKIAMEESLWAQEVILARLRGPEAIRSRIKEMGLDVEPPKPKQSQDDESSDWPSPITR